MGETRAQEMDVGDVVWWAVLDARWKVSHQERVQITRREGAAIDILLADGTSRTVLPHALAWQPRHARPEPTGEK